MFFICDFLRKFNLIFYLFPYVIIIYDNAIAKVIINLCYQKNNNKKK